MSDFWITVLAVMIGNSLWGLLERIDRLIVAHRRAKALLARLDAKEKP